jgi:hypothetical protein
MRHLNVGFAVGIIVGAAVIVITVLPIASWRAPAPPEDRSDELKLSDSCIAEIQAIPQKMLDYQNRHGFLPSAETFSPPCQKREENVWLYNLCLKQMDGDADRCGDTMEELGRDRPNAQSPASR